MMITWLLSLLLPFFVVANNVTIAIIGTNDIHGAAIPTNLSRIWNKTTVYYNYGGLIYMARLINIIKSQYPGNSVYLDAGDQFQGGIESSKLISYGKIMNDYFGLQQVNASAIGNHEFDFGPQFLFPFMKAKDGPILAANLRSQNGQSNFLPNQKASHLYSFASGIKIGVIGLATLETPNTTAGFTSHKFPNYKFLQYKDIVISEASKLRKNGADAVLIVGHVGNECNRNYTYKNWTKSDNQQGYCDEKDQIALLIKSLPEGTIQGVVQGHRHTVSHYFINGIPIMGNINGGFYFNVMYLTFSNKKVIDSKIEGPIPVCEKIFQKTGRCNYVRPQDDEASGPLINWKFHNQDVYADARLKTVYDQEWLPKLQQYLVFLVQNQVYLAKVTQQESQLGNLITTLVHNNFTQADFVVLNPGGYRTEWVPGNLQVQHLYNMFPFDNEFRQFRINGSALLETIKILQNGQKGFYNFWGIQCTVRANNASNHQFVSARMADGSQIDPDKEYIGITSDFLIQGGDDFSKIIPAVFEPKDVKVLGEFRSSIENELKEMKIIKEGSLIDPDNPRLIVLK